MSTPIADMIEMMTAAGVAPEMILLAVRTAELARGMSGGIPVDISAEKRRAWDRNRKAEKRNSGGMSGGIPPDEKPASTIEVKNEEKKEERLEAPDRKSGGRGTRLPNDWVPSDDDLVFAQRHGLNFDAANTEALKFRNYWTSKSGKDATKLDWPRTWQNWCLNARKPNGAVNGRPAGTLSDRAKELAGQIRERELALGVGRTPDPVGRG